MRKPVKSREHPSSRSEFGRDPLITAQARRLLGSYDRAELMIQAGLYAAGSDPMIDAAIRVWPALDSFLSEPEPAGIANSFKRLETALARAKPPT